MANPNNGDDRDASTHQHPYSSTRPDRQYTPASLFDTLWSLPSAIYQRGNEHGREFSRVIDERRREREEEQEREDGRGSRACGWRGARQREHWQRRRDAAAVAAEEKSQKEVESDENVMDDWVKRVVKELERGEKEAQVVYDEWWRKVEGHADNKGGVVVHQEESRQPVHAEPSPSSRRRRCEEAKKAQDDSWAAIFPAWSTKTPSPADNGADPHEHVFTRDPKCRPFTGAGRDFDETIDKLYRDFERWMGDASHMTRLLQNGYKRDSRLWEEEGLFGASMPFSRPLSTMFSLGMRPFAPEEGAMTYLIYSQYSPLHLEHEKGFDSSIRQKFEDLIRVQSGLEMSDKPKDAATTKVEWIGRIVPLLKAGNGDRGDTITISGAADGTLLEKIDRLADSPASTPQNTLEEISKPVQTQTQKSEGPDTEFDMYQWNAEGSQHSDQKLAPVRVVSTKQSGGMTPGSSILSTLTTTERNVSPDGSITVKTVLKKRFSDGRVMTSEKVETSPAVSRAEDLPQTKLRSQPNLDTKITKESGRGWFWSS